MVGAEPVTTRDFSQIPVEHLARLLLECARGDAALPRRSPANDELGQASGADDMFNRIEALPEQRRDVEAAEFEPVLSLPMVPAVGMASNEEMEELVASALTSAHDAEDVAREAHQAGRKTRRGMFVAVGLASIGIAIACAAAIGTGYRGAGNQQVAAIARQVRTLRDLQHQISDQLAQMQAQRSAQEASATPTQPSAAHPLLASTREASAALTRPSVAPPPPASTQEASAAPTQPGVAPTPPASTQEASATPTQPFAVSPLPVSTHPALLPPLHATPVRVLPRQAAAPHTVPPDADQPAASDARAVIYAPGYAAYAPPPAALVPAPATLAYVPPAPYVRPWPSYRRRVRHYRAEIVLPRPMAYVVVSARRDIRALFR
jgi:hypothetical protein